MRVEAARLTHTRDNSNQVWLAATMTVSFFNTGTTPMSLILPSRYESIDLALDNGLTLTPSRQVNHTTDLGLSACAGSLASCRDTTPDAFTQLDPGASVSLNFTLRDIYRANDPNLPSIPSVQQGNLAMRLHVIEGAADRIVQASFLNTPLQNGVRL